MTRYLIGAIVALTFLLTLLGWRYTALNDVLKDSKEEIQSLRMENKHLQESFEKYKAFVLVEQDILIKAGKREEKIAEQRQRIMNDVEERYTEAVEGGSGGSSYYLPIDYSDILLMAHERERN